MLFHVAWRTEGLLLVELLRVMRIEPPEVDQLRRRIDFGLDHRFRLTQHRGGVQRSAPRRRQQFGGLQEHRRTISERPVRPFAPCFERGLDRLVDVRGFGEMPLRQPMAMVVRHHHRFGPAGLDRAPADHEGNVDPLAGHLRKPRLELRAFWRTGQIALVRVVLWRGNTCGR